MQQAMYFQDEYPAKRFRVVFRLIVERASDVVTRHTQTNKPEWWKIGRFFESVKKCSLKKFKTAIWRSYFSYFSQNTLMLSDVRGDSIICILKEREGG